MVAKVHCPLDYLRENQLESEIFQHDYLFKFTDKIYVSNVRDRALLSDYENVTEEDGANFLAGDLSDERFILDYNYIDRVRTELKYHFSRIFNKEVSNVLLHDREERYTHLWVNRQKPGEFQPYHNHPGQFAFIFYPSIPEEIRQESSNQNKGDQSRGLIKFVAKQSNDSMLFNPSTGNLFIFSADHSHIVYPFRSNNVRVSIAGNIYGLE